MHELCKKCPFAVLMGAMRREGGEEMAGVHPLTVNLPCSQVDVRVFRQGTAILKPDDGTQGGGIYLVGSVSEAKRRMETSHMDGAVLQEYIARPLLLDGHKFDIRAYVLVLSLEPLRILMCREGMVRVCSQRYQPPDKGNMHRTATHLTNFSINKTNGMYMHNDDVQNGTEGGKRVLSAVLRHLASSGHDVDALFGEMVRVVGAGAKALAQAVLGHVDVIEPRDLWPLGAKRGQKLQGCSTPFGDPSWGQWQQDCFHLLGFDVMFDQQGTATLLEVNCNPSMALDSIHPLDGMDADVPIPLGPKQLGPMSGVYGAAMGLCKGRGMRPCRCLSHHRPHVHRPCVVDLAIKQASVGGALSIVARDILSRRQGTCATALDLARDTLYEVIIDESGPGG